jgi:histidinol-phosphate aminotransferase
MVTPRVHGGPDGEGVPVFDFSTNANARGPCPDALAAVRAADVLRYPDAGYAPLRARLARFHGVDAARIVPAGSGSEFIFRITAWAARADLHRVAVPRHAYGDYAAAAAVHGLTQVPHDSAELAWACEPSSPLGQGDPALADALRTARVVVLDQAYEPLRLAGTPTLDAARLDAVWQLWTPNKALGLTGVRGAYAIAPRGGEQLARELDAFAPSWVLGAAGLALLDAWCEPPVQRWLAQARDVLRDWQQAQLEMLQAMGWRCEPSDANFCVCDPGVADLPALLAHLRRHGIKLRDCASFGLPGRVRASVQPPAAREALRRAWETFR